MDNKDSAVYYTTIALKIINGIFKGTRASLNLTARAAKSSFYCCEYSICVI